MTLVKVWFITHKNHQSRTSGRPWEVKSATTVPRAQGANCKLDGNTSDNMATNNPRSDLVKKIGQSQADKVFAKHWCVFPNNYYSYMTKTAFQGPPGSLKKTSTLSPTQT